MKHKLNSAMLELAIKYDKIFSNIEEYTPILQAYMSQITPYAEHENLANVMYIPLNWKEIERVIAEHNGTATSRGVFENALSRESISGNTNENQVSARAEEVESNDAPRTSRNDSLFGIISRENIDNLLSLSANNKTNVLEMMMEHMSDRERYTMIEKMCTRFELTLNIEA